MLNTHIGTNYNANPVVNPNDLRKRIINVDSRFRSDLSASTTDFTYKLEHPYKNIISLRVASVEIPNMFYSFTKYNNSFTIATYDLTGILRKETIVIPPGNYSSIEIKETIQLALNNQLRNPYGIFIDMEVDTMTAKVTFTHQGLSNYPVIIPSPLPTHSAQPFIIDFVSSIPPPKKKNWLGLGTNLGFRQPVYKVDTPSTSLLVPGITTYPLTAPSCLDIVGLQYLLLFVNDFYTVEQRTYENYIQCLAKIIVREEKHMVIYDDGSTLLSNEIVFPSPVDLSKLEVRLADPFGETVDLCGMNFSFSLEIITVQNTQLYDFYRNYIWLGSIPSVNYKTVQGSAQPLLKGIGPPF